MIVTPAGLLYGKELTSLNANRGPMGVPLWRTGSSSNNGKCRVSENQVMATTFLKRAEFSNAEKGQRASSGAKSPKRMTLE